MFLIAEWWNMYGEEAPNLRNIAIKVLSQTCTSSGCERNWSTWSLIHTKLRNRLAIEKLHKLVFVHYNMRLRVKNLMYKNDTDDFYDPIDLNHIFDENDILDEWVRENEPSLIHENDLSWLDKAISESEGREQSHDSDHDNDMPLSQFITGMKKKHKERASTSKSKGTGKKKVISKSISSSSTKSSSSEKDDSSNDDDDGGANMRHSQPKNVYGSGSGGNYHDSQYTGGMSWGQGDDNYYATQDTDHGYRPGIEAQRQYLSKITEFSSEGDSAYNSNSRRYSEFHEHMQDLNIGHSYGVYDSGKSLGTRWSGHEFERSLAGSTSYCSEYGSYGGPSHLQRSTSVSTGSYGGPSHLQRSTSVSTGGYYNRPTGIHHDESAFDSRSIGYYGHNYGSSSSTNDSLHYRGFSYYHRGDEFGSNPPPLPHFNHGSSSASSNLRDEQYGSYISSHSHEENQMQMPYSYSNRSEDEHDFEPPRHSTWY